MRLRATLLRPSGGLRPLASIIKGLFANNEQGVWYDPSDLSTLYQDAAGTIPVTAVEQPVGLMLDKSKVLVLGAELASIGSQSVQNGSGTQTSGVWSVTASGTFAGVRQTTVFNAGSLYRITGSWSGNTNGRGITINFGGVGGVAYLGTAASGTINGYYFAGNNPLNIQIYAGNSVAGDTFSFSLTSIRELPGNHAIQTTATSRPVLSARVNLLTKTENAPAWGYVGTRCSSGAKEADGGFTLTALIENATILCAVSTDYPAGSSGNANTTIIRSIELKAGTASFVRLGGAASGASITIDLSKGTVAYNLDANPVSITALADGWYRLEFWKSKAAPYATDLSNYMSWGLSQSAGAINAAGQIGSTIKVRYPSFVVASLTDTRSYRYQRVNTDTDYDTAGFPYYLKFDGTDDWLVTPSIDFTSTDKMMVCAGVRKLSDSDAGMLAELSANGSITNGTFQVRMFLNSGNTGQGLAFMSRGTALVGANTPSVVAPSTIVFTGVGEISADIAYASSNSVKGVAATTDQGTGTYGNHPIYIGRRMGTSNPFNGHLYGMIIRGAATSDSQIKSVEKWVNSKTRAF